jgi:1,4-dihydroxy-2-naphthoate polyprenyltransferase
MFQAVKIWTYAARPKTLFISTSPVIIATAMALKEGCFHISTFFWTLLGALFIQIGTNYSNDYFDFLHGADTSSRKGPQKVLQQGLTTPRSMKRAFILCFSGAALCSILLAQRAGSWLLLVGALCIVLSILYTAPPLPLAYLGLGDLFVLVFYGPIATLCSYYLHTLHFSYEVLIASLAPGLLGVCILNLNNLRDHHEDKAVSKNTLIVRFGTLFGKFHYLSTLLLCFCIPVILVFVTKAHYASLLASASLFAIVPAIKITFTYQKPEQLMSAFVHTARIVPVYTCLFSLGWLL